jgi:geranyl-CoA carboxylase alpha subunit
MPGFRKLLIANRGEIAVRIIRTARRLGYRTVAVYSDADRAAPHVAAADEAVHLGPAPVRQSYLDAERLLAAARASGADAIHPGYGFFAENAGFARACAAAGLVFIGPSAEAIELMGLKRQAKLRMIEAGVPCIPGYEGADQSDEVLVREAERIGLPVMIKASAGGGGRGMRLSREAGELRAAIQSARSEAENAFGSGELILEKAVLGARHVEIQVFADAHGHAVHLGERDCSVQRRHQKIVEESPSPAVDATLRRRMGEVAVKAARAIDYVGAGTLEFLLAPSGEFYFMEMNTRLQVEHPVTECLTGLDLVAWQLQVAAGEPLPLGQDDIRFSGHAIEVRLCAEDPRAGFLPQTGPILAWEPPAGEGVRVDHGIARGGEVSPYYDSMLAKIIVHAENRVAALRRLAVALEETTLLGVVTNRDLLLRIVAHPAFAGGAYDTGFIPEHFPPRVIDEALAPAPRHLALAVAALYRDDALALGARAGLDAGLIDWSSSPRNLVTLKLGCGDATRALKLRRLGAERYEVGGDATFTLALDELSPGRLGYALDDGPRAQARYLRRNDELWLSAGGTTQRYVDLTLRPPEVSAVGGDGRLLAPMDGKILKVHATAGQPVKRGEPLLVLEAMKMEHQVLADLDGTVAEVLVTPATQVRARQLLIRLEVS